MTDGDLMDTGNNGLVYSCLLTGKHIAGAGGLLFRGSGTFSHLLPDEAFKKIARAFIGFRDDHRLELRHAVSGSRLRRRRRLRIVSLRQDRGRQQADQ